MIKTHRFKTYGDLEELDRNELLEKVRVWARSQFCPPELLQSLGEPAERTDEALREFIRDLTDWYADHPGWEGPSAHDAH